MVLCLRSHANADYTEEDREMPSQMVTLDVIPCKNKPRHRVAKKGLWGSIKGDSVEIKE
jgi:hypothetical protein